MMPLTVGPRIIYYIWLLSLIHWNDAATDDSTERIILSDNGVVKTKVKQSEEQKEFLGGLLNITVLLTSWQNGTEKSIKGMVKWSLDKSKNSSNGYFKLRISSLSSSNESCSEDFGIYENHRISQDRTSWKIPHILHSQERKILKFGCKYDIKLSYFPCNESACSRPVEKTVSYSIGNCVGDICLCSEAKLLQPWNLSLASQSLEKSDQDMTVPVTWDYAENMSSVHHFEARIYTLDAKISERKLLWMKRGDERVLYIGGKSSYNTSFNVSHGKEYYVDVAAYDDNHCRGSSISLRWLNTIKNGTINHVVAGVSSVSLTVLLIPVFPTMLLIGFIVIAYVYWKKKRPRIPRIHLRALQMDERVKYSAPSSYLTRSSFLATEKGNMNVLYVEKEIQEARDKGIADKFEICHGRLILGSEIGKGAFGRVCIATAESIVGIPGKITVAVKFLRETSNESEKLNFLTEIATMKKAGKHPNIVTMIACCTLQQPYCMVMEYVCFGDLLSYLRKLRAEYEKMNFCSSELSSLLLKSEAKQNAQSLSFDNRSSSVKSDKLPSVSSSDAHPLNKQNGFVRSHYNTGHSTKRQYDPVGSMLRSDHEFQLSCQETDISNCSNSTEETTVAASWDSQKSAKPFSQQTHLDVSLNSEELQSFSLQIADGMNHLSSKGIVHRDLAARNVLIDHNKTLKISDFGLSRTGIYVSRKGGRVPLRWLSLEAIRDHVYSSASDVWAFGVLLWEICTLGGFPYPLVADKELYTYLMDDNRLDQPLHCSDNIYSVMRSCWEADPERRPTFAKLRALLEDMTTEDHTYVNFDINNYKALPPITEDTAKNHVKSASSH